MILLAKPDMAGPASCVSHLYGVSIFCTVEAIQSVAKIAESDESASKGVALIPREILTIYCSLDLSFSNDY